MGLPIKGAFLWIYVNDQETHSRPHDQHLHRLSLFDFGHLCLEILKGFNTFAVYLFDQIARLKAGVARFAFGIHPGDDDTAFIFIETEPAPAAKDSIMGLTGS